MSFKNKVCKRFEGPGVSEGKTFNTKLMHIAVFSGVRQEQQLVEPNIVLGFTSIYYRALNTSQIIQ